MSSVGQSDAVIVGIRFAGATAAYALAKAGMRVLALEAGPYRTADEYQLDEITKSVFQRARLGPKFNTELQTWRPAGRGTDETSHVLTGEDEQRSGRDSRLLRVAAALHARGFQKQDFRHQSLR